MAVAGYNITSVEVAEDSIDIDLRGNRRDGGLRMAHISVGGHAWTTPERAMADWPLLRCRGDLAREGMRYFLHNAPRSAGRID